MASRTNCLNSVSGETIADEELARISPMAFAHIIPNGTYFVQGVHCGLDMALSVGEDSASRGKLGRRSREGR